MKSPRHEKIPWSSASAHISGYDDNLKKQTEIGMVSPNYLHIILEVPLTRKSGGAFCF